MEPKRPRNPHARAIVAPVTVTRVVDKVVAWHGICLACGRTLRSSTRYKLTCDSRCRQVHYRRQRQLRLRQAEEAEEQRLRWAEDALQRRRLGLYGRFKVKPWDSPAQPKGRPK